MATRRKKRRGKVGPSEREKKMDGPYFKALHRIVDRLFEEAKGKGWTWEEIADNSGLSRTTVFNLGARITKYPQYRTVELLALACGGRLEFRKGQEGRAPKPTWNLKIFSGRRKKQQAEAA